MNAFEDLKANRIVGLSEDDKLNVILSDVFNENEITEPVERISLLFGTVERNYQNNTTMAVDLKSAWGGTVRTNPYSDDPTGERGKLKVYLSRRNVSSLNDGDEIVFIPECGRLEKQWEILTASTFCKTRDLVFENDSPNPQAVLNKLLNKTDFSRVWNDIRELLQAKNAIAQMKTELQELTEEKAKLFSEVEEDETFLRKFNSLFPDGIEAARSEAKNLEVKIGELRSENEQLSAENTQLWKEADKTDRHLRDIKETEEKLGMSASEAIAKLDEYSQIKGDIEHARELAAWYLDGYGKKDSLAPAEEGALKNLKELKNCLSYSYPDAVLEPFLMALSTTQIITLFGKPGTGKTTFVSEISRALGAECTMISVQNNWTDSSDLLGYFNPMNESFSATRFLEALLDAKAEYDQKLGNARLHIICLDEMNLARVEYYFAEFLSLLQMEEDSRVISVLPSYIEREIRAFSPENADKMEQSLQRLKQYISFKLPPNVRFVGTINSDDTTNELSPKVIDRCFFIELRAEDCSRQKEPDSPTVYYPNSFFCPNPHGKEKDIFSKENGRFKSYQRQMIAFFIDRLGKKVRDEDLFVSYVILGKILPAIRKTADFAGSIYDDVRYALAQERYRLRPTDGENYYYLLGDN